MVPIAEQAAARGLDMKELLGETAATLRARGFEVPPEVWGAAELHPDPDNHAQVPNPTGWIWSVSIGLTEQIARELDREILALLVTDVDSLLPPR